MRTSKEKDSSRRKTRKMRSVNQLCKLLFEKDVTECDKDDEFELLDLQWTEEIEDCPVYYPSIEEFHDPIIYLQKISPEASKYGICKIVSPLKASVSAEDVLTKEINEFQFDSYVQPLRLAKWDGIDKSIFSKGDKKYSYGTFKSMADEVFFRQFSQSSYLPPGYLEKKFWYEMIHGRERTVEYGVNIEGSAFSSNPSDKLGNSKWNLQTLPKLPNSVLRLLEYSIPGVTDPMLYIGMLFSMFAWHVEDHYLYSINYHHYGAPKTWYGVPGEEAYRFEKVALDHMYDDDILPMGCEEDRVFEQIAHKTTMFPPNVLLQGSVPVYKAVQMPGEFVVTFPRAYHAGFSNGFNCGEAVNFAIRDWFPFGELAFKRYSRLSKMVILPFEELLFKEALLLSKYSSRYESSAAELITSTTRYSVKSCFVRHIRSINSVLWCLKILGFPFKYSPSSQGTILCDLCKCDCYSAFIECSCCFQHMCLFHEVESFDCLCWGTRYVYLREDIWEAEAAAKKFEQGTSMLQISNIISSIRHGLDQYCNNNLVSEVDDDEEEMILDSACSRTSKRPRISCGVPRLKQISVVQGLKCT